MQTICETLHGFSQNQDSAHISHPHQQISSVPNTLISYYNGNNNDDGIFEITVWDIDSNMWVFMWVCGSSFVCPRGEYPHQICAKSRNKSKLRENLLNSNLMDIRRRLSKRCGRSLLLLEQITSISTRIHFLEVKNCFEHTKVKFSNQNWTDIQKMRKFISQQPKIFCYRKFYRKLKRKVKWMPNKEQTGKKGTTNLVKFNQSLSTVIDW